MSPRVIDFFRRRARRLMAAAALVLAPKCFLCLATYVGWGTLLGGSELCGAPSRLWAVGSWSWPLAGGAIAAAGWLVVGFRR